MSATLAAVPEDDDEQLTFTIRLPRRRLEFALRNASKLFTEKELAEGMLLTGAWEGRVKGLKTDFDAQSTTFLIEVLEAEIND